MDLVPKGDELMRTGSTQGGDSDGRGRAGGRTIRRTLWAATCLAFGLVGASFTDVGQSYEGPVVGAFQAIRQGVRDRIDGARLSARNLGIEQQVRARLLGDKTFDGDRIELHVVDDCTVVLKGLVPDDEAKEKAVILARDTRGVLQVIDHLAVPPPPRVISASPEADQEAVAIDAPHAVAARTRRVQ
jgi:BON domain